MDFLQIIGDPLHLAAHSHGHPIQFAVDQVLGDATPAHGVPLDRQLTFDISDTRVVIHASGMSYLPLDEAVPADDRKRYDYCGHVLLLLVTDIALAFCANVHSFFDAPRNVAIAVSS
jgi:hypothetical protein